MKPIAIFRHVVAEGPGYFSDFLDARNISWMLIAIDQGEAVPVTASAYSGLVFMGGPMSVNDELPWIPPVLALIREAVALDIPVLGHCLGGQLISKALGGVVSKNRPLLNPLVEQLANRLSPQGGKSLVIPQAGEETNDSLREFQVNEIGWGEVNISDSDTARDWFGETQSFQAFHWHGETFSLPLGATHLLSSAACVNQAYTIGKHLALQCHVEMTEAMIAEWCAIGAEEIASTNSPYVQDAAEMQCQTSQNLTNLHIIASRLYTKWLAGALNSSAS